MVKQIAKRHNMFSNKKNSLTDNSANGSRSRSFARSNLFNKEDHNKTSFSGLRSSVDKRSLPGANSEVDSQTVTFKKFTVAANHILQTTFKKEEYAQLVSIPSMYKKICSMLLSDMSPAVSQEELEAKMKEFIMMEYAKQIQTYKIQFGDVQAS